MINTYFYIIKIYIYLVFVVYIKKRTSIKTIHKEFSSIENFDKRIKKRIVFYTIQSFFTNLWFSTLRGYKISEKERMCGLYIGALTPLLDDLNDKKKITNSEIISCIRKKEKFLCENFPLVDYLYTKVFQYYGHNFAKFSEIVQRAQDRSIRQLESKILSNSELRDITEKKGGGAVLFYRALLENPIEKDEIKLIYKLGYLLQLTNDLFDVYNDFQNRQQTLITNSINLREISTEFQFILDEIITNSYKLNHTKKNIKKFLCFVYIILVRGQICLKQLLNCQANSDGIFQLEKYSRKELICDMEKLSNIFKSIKYTVKFYRNLP